MRVLPLLSHSTTLFVLQQTVIVWFLVDFFLARDSATTNKLFNENLSRSDQATKVLKKIDTISSELTSNLTCDKLLVEDPTFDKLIFIVIDALGSEFISTLPQNRNANQKQQLRMPFLEQSIIDNKVMGFVAQAATPTVTMPRIKALVSGSIPSFMDVVYNVINNKPDFHEDSIISLAKSKGKSIVFYGDDTWLSLFDKSVFKRSRETLSLYASDYTTVDSNVTEMALPETTRSHIDWDFMILHYLGLDHIGHVYGVNESPIIDRKLLEMDSVIERIYKNMAAKEHRTLIVVCGDHGMSREGNHGGGSPLEAETAMLFLPINGQHTRVKLDKDVHISQIDLAITLALVTGLPTPVTSRGVFIEPFLKSIWQNDASRLACAYINNLKQLTSLLDDGQFGTPDGLGIKVLQLFNRMTLNTTSVNHQSFFVQGLGLAHSLQAHLVRVVASRSNNLVLIVIVVLVMALSLINLRRACYHLLLPLMSFSERLTCLGSLLVPIFLLNSTDFIEMEHVFWPVYLVTTLALFCLIALSTRHSKSIMKDIDYLRLFLFLFTLLISIMWNHVDFLGHQDWGWFIPGLSVLILYNFTRQNSKMNRQTSIVTFAFAMLVLVTKLLEENSEDHQQTALLQTVTLISFSLGSMANLFLSYRNGDNQPTSIVQKLAIYWMWWVLLLSRSRNYAFLVSNVIMEASLNSLANSFRFNPIVRAIIYLVCANNAFYGQGNTNLFSSLDIKPAFYGQTQYSLSLAVILIACATFGSHIYWYIKLFQRVQGEKEQERMTIRPELIDETNTSKLIPEGTKDAIKDFVDMRNFLTIAYYMFVCMVLRDHLFIWSVLSPKLVYLFMTTISIRITTAAISYLPTLTINVLGSKENETVKYKALIE